MEQSFWRLNMHNKHRVVYHRFDETGMLVVLEERFHFLEEAMAFINSPHIHRFKIYDEYDQVIHAGSNQSITSYA